MFKKHRHIILFLVVFAFLSSCNTAKLVPKGEHILIKNKIESTDDDFNTEPIYNYLKQKENTKTALFFNFHLWLFNMAHDKSGKEKKLKKWLGIYKLGDIAGEAPVILDKDLIHVSGNQINKYMRNKGYYDSKVRDTVIYYGRANKKAKVLYKITPGEPMRIDSVFCSVQDTGIKRIIEEHKSNSYIKKNSLLDVDMLQNERVRITNLLKEKGYFLFNKEYIYYQVDTLDKKPYTASLELKILNPKDSLHRKFTINNVYFFNNFNPQDFLRLKDDYYADFDTLEYQGKYFLNNQKKSFIKPKVIVNNSYIEKGQLYSSSNVQNTFKQLSSLNEFKLINIRYNRLPKDAKVDVLVQLTPFKKHNYITEIEGTNTSGNFGIGGGLKYQHKSLFGRAEILNVNLFGKLETRNDLRYQTENLSFNSRELGTIISLDFPKFLLPFRSEKFIKKNHPRTTLEFNFNYKKRPEYTVSVYGGSFGYYWVSRKYFRHKFKPINVNSVKVFDMRDSYRASIKNTYLERSFDDFLITSSIYTMYFSNKKERRNFFNVLFTTEIAGNILNWYSQATEREKVDGSYQFFDNTFAQFWKTELDITFNQAVGKDHLVYRLYGGLAHPYGNISVMPYIKQFYSGGASGIRAWSVKSLGPGSYSAPSSRFHNEVADFKFEGNLEYRFKLFWVVEGAWFADFGNIWSLNPKDNRQGAQFDYKTFLSEIAIGTGLGFRFDFSFLIFRVDLGLKVKDPKEPVDKRWLWQSKDNPLDYEYTSINFGIGYPF